MPLAFSFFFLNWNSFISFEQIHQPELNMLRKYIIIIILLLCVSPFIKGQDFNEIDSLNKLFIQADNDSDRVALLTKISVHFWFNNPDTSIYIAQKGIDLAEKSNLDVGKANSLHVMAYAYFIKGNYAAALDINLKALKIRERINDKKGLERSYNNIGNIYLDKKDYGTAYVYYLKGLALAEELKITRDIALLNNNIGRMYYFKNEYKKSLDYYYTALEISNANHYKFEQVISNLNLGRSFVALGEYDKAEQFLNKGLELSVQMRNKEKISMAYNSLAEIAHKNRNYLKSIKLGKKALESAKEIKSLAYINEAATLLYENYKALGDYQNALQYYLQADENKEKMFNNEKMKEISDLQYHFQIENHENEIKILEQENKISEQKLKTQSLYFIFISVALFLALVLGVVVFASRYRIQKANQLLRLQKAQIADQNRALTHANEEIVNQNEIISYTNNRITSGITYAARIQKAMLPPPDVFSSLVSDYFILYKPKDIVSGDFFWYRSIGDHLYIAVADCTGHGVPGAFISMLGISLLSEVIGRSEIRSPALVLDELRTRITQVLNQTGQDREAKDGMDIALLLIDLKNFNLQFAGAYNPLYIIRPSGPAEKPNDNLEFIELKSDRMPVGIFHRDINNFNNYQTQISKNDRLYIFSDGYISQFGGERGETLKSKRFKDCLMRHAHKPMQFQLSALEQEFAEWSGDWEQVDDVLVMGVRF